MVQVASGEPAERQPKAESAFVELSYWWRAILLFVGVVLPIICLVFGFPENPRWQSGELKAYAELLLSPGAVVPLYPFLLYSMLSLVLLVVKPQRFSTSAFVRWGILSGAIVAAEFWLLFQLAVFGAQQATLSPGLLKLLPMVMFAAFATAITVVVPWGIAAVVGSLWRTARRTFWWLAATLMVFALIMCVVPLFYVCLWAATPWALAAYLIIAIQMQRAAGGLRWQFGLAPLLAACGWIGAHLGAWRWTFEIMLQQYALLPLKDPGQCFLCTAAAQGHRRIVRSELFAGANGKAYLVNNQLRYFKAFELLLLSISPGVHRGCRWVYDRVGPRLASACACLLLADACYFLLKPAEGAARLCLAVALPGRSASIRRLYRSLPNEIAS